MTAAHRAHALGNCQQSCLLLNRPFPFPAAHLLRSSRELPVERGPGCTFPVLSDARGPGMFHTQPVVTRPELGPQPRRKVERNHYGYSVVSVMQKIPLLISGSHSGAACLTRRGGLCLTPFRGSLTEANIKNMLQSHCHENSVAVEHEDR